MPPKKEKTEKTSVEAGTALVLEYLKQQNRPYSAIDISANLHNKVTKTQAAKILKDLTESNQIASKASGKQSVYHSIQDPKDNLNPQQLQELDDEIQQLRDDVSDLKDQEKVLKSELLKLKATMTLAELKSQSNTLSTQKTELEGRLAALQSGQVKAVSVEEKQDIDRSWKLWSYKSKARKKAFMELWQTLCDNLPDGKSKDDLWNELGLETPEDG